MNKDHLEILNQGVKFWNQWRKKNPEIVPDLSGTNLSGKDLSRMNLSGVDMRKTNLTGTNMNKTITANANFGSFRFDMF